MTAIHHLKTHPEPFAAVRAGRKTFEFRRDDRPGGFMEGDLLVLLEWNPEKGSETGEREERRVGYTLHGPAFGIPDGFCIMALEPAWEPETA